jgi:hypothetical protein
VVTKVLADVAALGTFFGVVFAGVQLVYNRHQARTQFEDNLTALYRSIVSELPVEVFFSEPVSDEIVKKHLPVLYRYFDLCNEQAFLFEEDRINDETWEQWKEGIDGNMGRFAFKTAWYEEIEPNIDEDFQEFKDVLKSLGRPASRERAGQRSGELEG